MSDEETQAQVGSAVLAYQAAKVSLAHLDKRIADTADAYEECSKALRQNRSFQPTRLAIGELGMSDGTSLNAASLLRNQAELSAILNEREQTRARLKSTGDAMKALGVTSVD